MRSTPNFSLRLRSLRLLALAATLAFFPGCGDATRSELMEAKVRIAQLETEGKINAERAKAAERVLEQKVKESSQRVGELEAELKVRGERQAASERNLAEAQDRAATTARELAAAKERAGIAEAKIAVYEADRSKAAKAEAEAARQATLMVQLGVTMKSGDTKPVTNTTVYLLRSRLLELVPEQFTYNSSGRRSEPSSAASVLQFASLYDAADRAKVASRIREGLVAESTTDFSGRATFEGVPPGKYAVLCVTPLGGGAVLEKVVAVQGRSSTASLGNDDIIY